MIYVMSDIHGYYESFLKMLKKIEFGESDTLYIIGDLIDRGPSSLDLIDFCLGKDNIKVLKGNHEYMLEMSNRELELRKCWLKSGGDVTLEEIEKKHGKDSEYEQKVIRWIEDMPLYTSVRVKGERYLLTHAGLKRSLYDKYIKENKIRWWNKVGLVELYRWVVSYLDYEENSILWHKGIFESKVKFTKDYIIVGHTPTKSRRIEKENRVYSIDCGSYVKGGRLGCLCLNNMREYYVSTDSERLEAKNNI